MTSINRPGTVFLVACSATFLFACNSPAQTLKRPNMTELTPRLQAIFESSKTVCFGQFILEVPATATLVYGDATVEARIRYFPGESSSIDDHIKQQLAEVEEDRKRLPSNVCTA